MGRRWILFATAAVFAGLGVGAWRLWHDSPHNTFIRAWAPNAGTAFFAAAITLAVIELILLRHTEAREATRTRPLTTSAFSRLHQMLSDITAWMGYDYFETHPAAPTKLPQEASKIIDTCIAGADTMSAPRRYTDPVPAPVMFAIGYLPQFEDIRRYDREDIPVELVVALGAFVEQLRKIDDIIKRLPEPDFDRTEWNARWEDDFEAPTNDARVAGLEVAAEVLGRAMRDLVVVYEQEIGGVRLDEEQQRRANVFAVQG